MVEILPAYMYLKFWTQKIALIIQKVEHYGFAIIHPHDAGRMANSADPDQTAPSVCISVF